MFQNFNEWNLPETIPDPGWDSLVPLRVHPDWYQEVEKKGAIKPNCDAISTNDEVDSVSELPDSVEEGEIDYNNEIESEEDQIISNNDLWMDGGCDVWNEIIIEGDCREAFCNLFLNEEYESEDDCCLSL